MNKHKRLIKAVFCICMVIVEILLYFSISKHIADKKVAEAAEEARYFRTNNEFLITIDCATLFDTYPGYSFELTFEICAKRAGKVLVYQQNGEDCRYAFSQVIDVTEEYKEFCLVVDPVLVDETVDNSYLAFYGEYGSGIIPTVRDISIVPIEK